MQIFIGTETHDGASQGIYRCHFDPEQGKAGPPQLAAATANPSWLCLHPGLPILYSVCEDDGLAAVQAFTRSDDGSLTPLGQACQLDGRGACHALCDGHSLLVACYPSATVASIQLARDGSLREVVSCHHLQGSGPYPGRQRTAHAHSTCLAPGGARVWAADLGSDKIWQFSYDAASSELSPDPATPWHPTLAGGGPRHFAVHPNGRWVYYALEMAGAVSHACWDATSGDWQPLLTSSCIRGDYPWPVTASEIALSPDGRFLTVAVRGPNELATFAIDPDDGSLSDRQLLPCGGDWPRHFAYSPDGRWLIVANQQSYNCSIFAVEPASGRLRPTGRHLQVAAPKCIRFIPSPGPSA